MNLDELICFVIGQRLRVVLNLYIIFMISYY